MKQRKFQVGDIVTITKGEYKTLEGVVKSYTSPSETYNLNVGEWTVDIIVEGDIQKVKLVTSYLKLK